MKWTGRRESSNVDDRRGIGGGGLAVGGGIIGVIVLLVKFFVLGDTSAVNDVLPQQGGPQQEMSAEEKKLDDERASFVKVVLADTEDVWNQLYSQDGKKYVEPTLVLFRQSVLLPDLSTAPAINRYISICRFLKTCRIN
jgi:uncharacterized protein